MHANEQFMLIALATRPVAMRLCMALLRRLCNKPVNGSLHCVYHILNAIDVIGPVKLISSSANHDLSHRGIILHVAEGKACRGWC